jgi:hypothetical protein
MWINTSGLRAYTVYTDKRLDCRTVASVICNDEHFIELSEASSKNSRYTFVPGVPMSPHNVRYGACACSEIGVMFEMQIDMICNSIAIIDILRHEHLYQVNSFRSTTFMINWYVQGHQPSRDWMEGRSTRTQAETGRR